ncbi:hypothetical protein ILYODFUR_031971 [Ilyodon furcidens]|uniref:Uncharacterized protein n=1 Tax=Ilyodon furcidens TaxID=33524 RepID=A0ABV0U0P6_9TELE
MMFDAMQSNKVPRVSRRETDPEYHRPSEIRSSVNDWLFHIFILSRRCWQITPLKIPVAFSKLLIYVYDGRTEKCVFFTFNYSSVTVRFEDISCLPYYPGFL